MDRRSILGDRLSPAATPWDTGTGLAGYCWAAERPRALLLLQHGYAEYAERFVREHGGLIPHLVAAGISVFAFDLPGHGRSPGTRGVVDIDVAVQHHITARAMLENSGLPLLLLGHSLGGLITAASVLASGHRLSGVVLTSPAFDRRNAALRLMAERVAKISPEWGMAPQQSSIGLSRCEEAVQRFVDDPMIYRGPLPALMAASALRVAQRVYLGALAWKVPALIVHGTADPFTSHEDSAAVFKRLGAHDKTINLIPDGRHELLSDIDGDRILSIVLDWIDKRLPTHA